MNKTYQGGECSVICLPADSFRSKLQFKSRTWSQGAFSLVSLQNREAASPSMFRWCSCKTRQVVWWLKWHKREYCSKTATELFSIAFGCLYFIKCTFILRDPRIVSKKKIARQKVTRKFTRTSEKSPLAPTTAFPNGSANAGFWLGRRNPLYYSVPNQRTAGPLFASVFLYDAFRRAGMFRKVLV